MSTLSTTHTLRDAAAVVAALADAPGMLVPLIREVPEQRRRLRPGPGKWSAHEHAAHLAETHDLIERRLEIFLNSPDPVIVPYFPDDREIARLAEQDLETILDRFARERRDLVARLKLLPFEAWEITARHDEYNHYSLFIMMRHMALHDFLHGYRIEEILLKKDWSGAAT